MLALYRGNAIARRQINRAARYGAGLLGGAAAAGYGVRRAVRATRRRVRRRHQLGGGYQPPAALSGRARGRRYTRTRGFVSGGRTQASKIRKLEKFVAAQTSVRVCRNFFSTTINAAENDQNILEQQCPNVTTLQSCIDDLRFFNPSVPNTLITTDLQSATFPQNIAMNYYCRITLKNNYISPVRVRVYLCKVKADTGISGLTAMTNGLADNPSGALVITDLSIRPRDSEQFKDLWSSKLVKSTILKAGQQCVSSHASGSFSLDPATLDSHTSAFQRKLKGAVFLIVVNGLLAHNTTGPDVGLEQVRLDVQRDFVIKAFYDSGGVDLHDIQIVNSLDTFATTPALSSHQPVAVNQGFDTDGP